MACKVVDLDSRRHRRPRPAPPPPTPAEHALSIVIRMVALCPDPTEAALNVICGFAMFVAARGVTTDEIVQFVARRIAESLAAEQPASDDGPDAA